MTLDVVRIEWILFYGDTNVNEYTGMLRKMRSIA